MFYNLKLAYIFLLPDQYISMIKIVISYCSSYGFITAPVFKKLGEFMLSINTIRNIVQPSLLGHSLESPSNHCKPTFELGTPAFYYIQFGCTVFQY
jgi:hypothetical protein